MLQSWKNKPVTETERRRGHGGTWRRYNGSNDWLPESRGKILVAQEMKKNTLVPPPTRKGKPGPFCLCLFGASSGKRGQPSSSWGCSQCSGRAEAASEASHRQLHPWGWWRTGSQDPPHPRRASPEAYAGDVVVVTVVIVPGGNFSAAGKEGEEWGVPRRCSPRDASQSWQTGGF